MLTTDMIEIHVGKYPKQTFFVHEKLLRSKVPYFETMLKNQFKETLDRKVYFPKDNAEAFEFLLHWIYTGKIDLMWPYDDYVAVLLLADKFCITGFVDQITTSYIDATCNNNNCVLVVVHILAKYTYQKLPGHLAFRKFFVHLARYVLHGKGRNDTSMFKVSDMMGCLEYPDFLKEYVQSIVEVPVGELAPDPRKLPRCTYHQHAADEPCSVAK